MLEGLCPACLWSGLLSDDGSPQPAGSPDIPGHDVFEEIGQGGMGLVYRARQHQPPREVALKIVAPYSLRLEEARQRFMMEVEAMAALEHPAVLPLYQSGEDDHGHPWLTMQFVRGGSLADHINRYSGSWPAVIELMLKLCDAVGFAHEHGLLHRDLKPANVLFDEAENPFIADFGLAKWAEGESGISQTSYLLGSPAYLAPEAAKGGSKLTTTVSDVYALGAILYELLTGRSPYQGNSPNEIVTKIISSSPPPPRRIEAGVPRDLEVIALKAMSREPGQRYHSAKALGDDLTRWRRGLPILARPPAPTERLWLWAKRNPADATLSLLLLLSLAVGGILLSQKNRHLATALHDAERRVDFMVRELPGQIAPIGRLEVLDSVFEDVAEHYENLPPDSADSLARRADFQTQWSQILRPRALTDEALVHLREAHRLARLACETHRGDLPLAIVRSRAAAGWRYGECLIEDEDFARAESILDETSTFLTAHRTRFPGDLQLAHLEAGLALERIILLSKTDRAELALQAFPDAEKLWEHFHDLLEEAPSGAAEAPFKIEYARVPYFLANIHGALGDLDGKEAAIGEYYDRTARLMAEEPENLPFAGENFIAQILRAVLYHESDRGDGPEITRQLLAADQHAQQIHAQDPGNVKWSSHSTFLAINLAQLAKMRGDHEAFQHWLTILDKRLHRLYQLPNTDIDSLRTRCNAALFVCENHGGRDWSWVRPHNDEALKLQAAICRQTRHIKSFHNLRRLIRIFTEELVQHEGNPGALQWLEEFSTLLDKERQTPGISAEQTGWWHVALGFTWGQREKLGDGQARQKANSHLLRGLEQAEELLTFHYLRPPNRLELFNNLLTAAESTDLAPETKTRLIASLRETVPLLAEDDRADATRRLEEYVAGSSRPGANPPEPETE